MKDISEQFKAAADIEAQTPITAGITTAPAPAGPTTIPEHECKRHPGTYHAYTLCGGWCDIVHLENELARERRRCEMQEERIEALVKALEEIKTLSTRHLNHLPSGPCVVHTEAWSVAQAALNAAKALQGQDGAK
jgi:hypothetical protein